MTTLAVPQRSCLSPRAPPPPPGTTFNHNHVITTFVTIDLSLPILCNNDQAPIYSPSLLLKVSTEELVTGGSSPTDDRLLNEVLLRTKYVVSCSQKYLEKQTGLLLSATSLLNSNLRISIWLFFFFSEDKS